MTDDRVLDLVERLAERCIDWDGTEMADGAETMMIECGELRELLAEIRRLRADRAAIERETLELAAEVAEEFSWTLPVHNRQDLNEVSDDAACAVQNQIAAAIRALADHPIPSAPRSSDGGRG